GLGGGGGVGRGGGAGDWGPRPVVGADGGGDVSGADQIGVAAGELGRAGQRVEGGPGLCDRRDGVARIGDLGEPALTARRRRGDGRRAGLHEVLLVGVDALDDALQDRRLKLTRVLLDGRLTLVERRPGALADERRGDAERCDSGDPYA